MRVSATSGWAAAVAASALGSHRASMTRPRSNTAPSQPASVRRAWVTVKGVWWWRTSVGALPNVKLSVTGPS